MRRQGAVPTLQEARYSQSLERGLAILQVFTPERPVLGIADIADELGMSRSTTHRYVITLVQLGFLEQGASRKYRLGLRVEDIGMLAVNARDERKYARKHLDKLREQTSHTASIAVLDGIEVVFLDRARSYSSSDRLLGLRVRTGCRVPAHRTAMGKVLLAFLSGPELNDALSEIEYESYTARTTASKTALTNELREIRKLEYATNNEENERGAIEVAVPVLDGSGGVTAAVGVLTHKDAVPLERLVTDARPHLEEAAKVISAALGYKSTPDKDS